MTKPSCLELTPDREIIHRQVGSNKGLIETQGELRFDHAEIPLLHFELLPPLLARVACPPGTRKSPLYMAAVTSSVPPTVARPVSAGRCQTVERWQGSPQPGTKLGQEKERGEGVVELGAGGTLGYHSQ